MSDAISSLGSVFSGGTAGGVPNWMKLILGGLTASGEVGNIMAGQQRSNLMNEAQKWEQLTPQQLSAKIAAATQPLNQGLVQGVGNTVSAQMGERGLAQAPGIFSAEESQALAPYYQQNQATALQTILAQMGLPVEMARLLPNQTNLAPLLQLLLGSFGKGGGGLPPSLLATANMPASTVDASIPDWSLPTLSDPSFDFGSTTATTNPFGMLNSSGLAAGLQTPSFGS